MESTLYNERRGIRVLPVATARLVPILQQGGVRPVLRPCGHIL